MVGGETHLTWSLRFSASSIKRLQRHPVLIGVQMFCSQVVVENKTQLRSPTQNFGQDVSVLKQLRTGVFFLLQGDKCAHKTTVSLRIHLLTCDKILSRDQLRQFGFALQMFQRSFLFPSSGINHSEKLS